VTQRATPTCWSCAYAGQRQCDDAQLSLCVEQQDCRPDGWRMRLGDLRLRRAGTWRRCDRAFDVQSHARESSSLTGGYGANLEHGSELNRHQRVRTAPNCTTATRVDAVFAGQRVCWAGLAVLESSDHARSSIIPLSCGNALLFAGSRIDLLTSRQVRRARDLRSGLIKVTSCGSTQRAWERGF
jgi:hypothetical protein